MPTERIATLEARLFKFLTRKYVQRADARQRAMGLQYTEAETHDLAGEIARFVVRDMIVPRPGEHGE
jgi:hypothetical protein